MALPETFVTAAERENITKRHKLTKSSSEPVNPHFQYPIPHRGYEPFLGCSFNPFTPKSDQVTSSLRHNLLLIHSAAPRESTTF